MNPLDIRLGDYLAHLEDKNWHTLAMLILMERNQLDEDTARDMLSVYLTANQKRQHLNDRKKETRAA